MKHLFIVLLAVFFISIGLAQTHQHEHKANKTTQTAKVVYTCPMHPEVQSDKPGKCPKCGMNLVLQKEKSESMHNQHDMKSMDKETSSHQQHDKTESTIVTTKTTTPTKSGVVNEKVVASIQEIVGHYLELKNGLVSDKANNAASAGKAIVDAMGKLDKSLMTAAQKEAYDDVEDDAKEHAEHIGENAGDIEHQREHFDMLSKDVYDLVKVFGAGQLLYKDFCPMYNDKKGAFWLSEKKEIKNPYYGKKMLTCGSIKEEIK